MRRLGRGMLLAALVFVPAACATMNISSHVLPEADFARYHTFGWGPADALPTGDPRLDKDPFFQDHVLGAVERGLAARGLTAASSGTPDLLIHYHASVSQRLDVNRLDREHGYCFDDDCRVRVVEVETATLVLDLVDARTNRLVWRGWARNNFLDTLDNSDRLERDINAAVGGMLARYPAGPAAPVRPQPAQTGGE